MKLKLLVLALLVVAPAWAGPQSRPRGTGDAKAHFDRGTAFYAKGDHEGAIVEWRGAVRLKPDWALAHKNFGNALDDKGERQAALEEYRRASELDPKNDGVRRNYDRLSKELKK